LYYLPSKLHPQAGSLYGEGRAAVIPDFTCSHLLTRIQWDELYPSKIHVDAEPPLLQNVTVFVDKAFKDMIK
jgi:hypothetical protein